MSYKDGVTVVFLFCLIAATAYASTGMLASNNPSTGQLPDKCAACTDGPFGLCAKEDCLSQDDCGFRRVFWKYGRCYLKSAPQGQKGCDTFCYGRSVKCVKDNYQICADPDFDGCNDWIDVYDSNGQLVLCRKKAAQVDCPAAGGECLAQSSCSKCYSGASCGSGQCCCLEKQAVCVNKCGDGICDQVVCTGTDCPCAETASICPQDCQPAGAYCGNNLVEAGEACDGSDLAGRSCTGFGSFTGGTLMCVNCEFDTGLCTSQQGGNSPAITIVPATANPELGSKLSVDIQLNGMQDISGLEVSLNYDASRLRYEVTTAGSFFDFCPITPVSQDGVVTKLACAATSP
ncbi:MAG: cohesin domain-containing protein, partial [Candidatus Woesearchaeota archaeon]